MCRRLGLFAGAASHTHTHTYTHTHTNPKPHPNPKPGPSQVRRGVCTACYGCWLCAYRRCAARCKPSTRPQAGSAAPCVCSACSGTSLYLPVSPCISLYLPASPDVQMTVRKLDGLVAANEQRAQASPSLSPTLPVPNPNPNP